MRYMDRTLAMILQETSKTIERSNWVSEKKLPCTTPRRTSTKEIEQLGVRRKA